MTCAIVYKYFILNIILTIFKNHTLCIRLRLPLSISHYKNRFNLIAFTRVTIRHVAYYYYYAYPTHKTRLVSRITITYKDFVLFDILLNVQNYYY